MTVWLRLPFPTTRKAIVDPYAFLPSGYPAGVMPSNFGTKLHPNEITALVNFLSSASK